MKHHIIEATAKKFNHGKFMLGQFDEADQRHYSEVDPDLPILAICGWGNGSDYVHVLDLQTGEGAVFKPGGCASADLDKHRIWVCPLFEPFLEWLYTQNWRDFSTLPDIVDLPNAETALAGYRRTGAEEAQKDTRTEQLVVRPDSDQPGLWLWMYLSRTGIIMEACDSSFRTASAAVTDAIRYRDVMGKRVAIEIES